MSDSRRSRQCCHHRTSVTQSRVEDGQQAGRSSGGARITGRCRHPLRRGAGALAGVAARRVVLRLDRRLSTDLGVHGVGPSHHTRAGRGNPAQRRSSRALGVVEDRGDTVRASRRGRRTGARRGSLRSTAADLCRHGSRLGAVPGPLRPADTRAREHAGATRRCGRRRTRLHGRGGFGTSARPPCTARGRGRSPRAERGAHRGPQPSPTRAAVRSGAGCRAERRTSGAGRGPGTAPR